jgi:ribosomal protein L27
LATGILAVSGGFGFTKIHKDSQRKELGVVQAANNQVMAGILRVCFVSKGNAASPRAFYLP